MNRRIGALGAIAVLVVLALGISNASAASLSVTAGKLGVFAGAPRCVTVPLAVAVSPAYVPSGSYAAVTLTNVPVTCAGRAVRLTLYNASGVSIVESAMGVNLPATLSFPNTITVTMPSYVGATVSGAALVIGGYGVTTTWTGPAGAAACVVTGVFPNGVSGTKVAPTTETCSVTITVNSVNKGNGGNQNAQLTIVVTNNSTSIIQWRVDAHLAQVTPLLPFTPKHIANDVTLDSVCSAMPDVSISGTSATVTFFVYEKSQNSGTSC